MQGFGEDHTDTVVSQCQRGTRIEKMRLARHVKSFYNDLVISLRTREQAEKIQVMI